MRRALLFALLCALAFVPTAAASSLTLTLYPSPATLGDSVRVSYRSTIDHATGTYAVGIYLDPARACGRTVSVESARGVSRVEFLRFAAGTQGSSRADFTPSAPGEYLVCGYLYRETSPGSTPISLATASLSVLREESAPTLSGPTRQSIGGGSIYVLATCSRTCTLAGTATIAVGLTTYTLKSISRSDGTVRATRVPFITFANQKALKSAIAGPGSIIANVTVTATYASGHAYSSTRSITLSP
jgi:hypothetical protein